MINTYDKKNTELRMKESVEYNELCSYISNGAEYYKNSRRNK